jgi:hypothetical protein
MGVAEGRIRTEVAVHLNNRPRFRFAHGPATYDSTSARSQIAQSGSGPGIPNASKGERSLARIQPP